MRVYVLIGLAALVASCGDAPTAPTPQPAPAVVAPVTPIAPLAPAAVVEPFCPFLVVDNLTASRREGRVEVSWNVTIGPAGQYLHRYQIEVRRRTGDDKAHEVQVSGRVPRDRSAAQYAVVLMAGPGGVMRHVQTTGTCPPLHDNTKRKPTKKGKR
jgi:hypothetical protein